MKKRILLTLLCSTLLLTFFSCKKEKNGTDELGNCEPFADCYKGRLEIKDICGNYTIKVLEGSIDPSLIQATWQHPATKFTYQNVFSLGNSCSFPDSIKEGDVFYFSIRDNKKEAACVQCLAYVPTPDKTLSINVSASPCIRTND